jgi:hypothetical protein
MYVVSHDMLKGSLYRGSGRRCVVSHGVRRPMPVDNGLRVWKCGHTGLARIDGGIFCSHGVHMASFFVMTIARECGTIVDRSCVHMVFIRPASYVENGLRVGSTPSDAEFTGMEAAFFVSWVDGPET